ncbi:MAG: hypothetical protein MJK18_01205, partial [Bdellovibrionales bacterium]|nr:hypothetical protein [Bdellovibrionales bacterium]
MFFLKSIIATLALAMVAQSAMACPSGLRPFNKQLEGKDTCVLEGDYTGTLELSSGFNYIILNNVFIGKEVRDEDKNLLEPIVSGRLIVNAGVKIFALNPTKDTTGVWANFTDANGNPIVNDAKSFISVTRDSIIEINGTEAAPVVMTSAQGAHLGTSTQFKQPGDWGGLVISGKAKTNRCWQDMDNCTVRGEAATGWYGGNDDEHRSGSINYLQVEYGGDRINGEKELNGVTFNSVGLGTEISNVAVLYNADDCIEFFG